LPTDKLVTSEGEQRIFASVLKKKQEQLQALRDGQSRNQFFNNSVLELSEMCSGWGIDPRIVERTLMQAMEENGSFRDHGAGQVQATFKSAFQKGSAQPRAREFVPNIDTSALNAPPLTLIDEKPRPLRRAIAEPNPFPVNALGPFYWPTLAIVDKIQCPPAIAALSVLGVASLAIQAHADVVLPRTGHVKPLSLFLVSIGESGERKSAADNEAKRAINDYERDLTLAYELELPAYRNARDAWESERQAILRNKNMNAALKSSALDHLIEPQAPLTPMLTCPEPTFEGLCQLFFTGHGALGLFSDEGGHFVGGHALSEDTRLRTAAGLSSLWDGSPIKRVRAAKDGSYVLPGRRLAMHLMLQPNVAAGLLSDPILKDQGLLSRILVSYPQSTAGTRFQKEANAHAQASLEGFTKALASIVRYKPMSAPGKRNELTPRHLQFDPASHQMWCSFADKVESELARFGKYESIKGLANKLPEHAARLAGIMALYQNFYATHISVDSLRRGITLAEHFACEALRLFDAGLVRAEIALAESLLEWLTNRWIEPHVSTRVIQRIGPNGIRDAKAAQGAIATLVEHGWLSKAQPGTLVEGVSVREAWKIIRE